MQRVPLKLVKPGMVLAKPVLNEKGMPLCAEGAELNDTIIERLMRMRIETVVLKGNPVDLGGDVKTREELVAEMKQRFQHVQGDLLMERIKEAAEKAFMADEEEPEEEAAQQEDDGNE